MKASSARGPLIMAQNLLNTIDDVSYKVPMHEFNSLSTILACCLTDWPSRRLLDILTNNMGKCQTLFSLWSKSTR